MLTDLEQTFPVRPVPVALDGDRAVGLIVVDAGVAFTRSGSLSDPLHMIPMVRRIGEHARALRAALGDRLHVLCFLDTHHPDIPEPPYPPHGVIGTGEEEMDPDLAWLLGEPQVTVVRKDCINGFVGGIDVQTGQNAVVEWVRAIHPRHLLVTGDCTDMWNFGWYPGLFEDPLFADRYWTRFSALLDNELSGPNLDALILELAADLDEAAARDRAEWGGAEFRSEIDELRSWMATRHGWMRACIDAYEDPRRCPGR